jgi:hypothetical protein
MQVSEWRKTISEMMRARLFCWPVVSWHQGECDRSGAHRDGAGEG